MADTTTALDVLDGIAQDLGGTGGYDTLVPELQKIRELLAAGGAVADGSITTAKLAGKAVTTAKLADGAVTSPKIATDAVTGEKIANYSIPVQKLDIDATDELTGYKLYSVDATTQQTLSALGFASLVLSPEFMSTATLADTRTHLCWIDATSGYVEKAPISFSGNLQAQTITIWSNGLHSKATGVMGVDTSWTVTSL